MRQGIYEWRDDYYDAVTKLADVKLTALQKKLGVEKMRVWVEKALSEDDGAAYWDVPGTEVSHYHISTPIVMLTDARKLSALG